MKYKSSKVCKNKIENEKNIKNEYQMKIIQKRFFNEISSNKKIEWRVNGKGSKDKKKNNRNIY